MTRDELIEALALKLWPDMPFNVRAVMTRDLPPFLDALDALGQGPKRVAELERACNDSEAMLTGYAADLQKAEARMAELEKLLHPLAAIADEYDCNALDEARPEWGDKPDGVEIYSGRGGKRLLTLGEARAALDALDALGMGPKRVVELEKEVDRLQEGWQTATKMLERGDVNGATHVLSTGMVPSNYHAALKGQSND